MNQYINTTKEAYEEYKHTMTELKNMNSQLK